MGVRHSPTRRPRRGRRPASAAAPPPQNDLPVYSVTWFSGRTVSPRDHFRATGGHESKNRHTEGKKDAVDGLFRPTQVPHHHVDNDGEHVMWLCCHVDLPPGHVDNDGDHVMRLCHHPHAQPRPVHLDERGVDQEILPAQVKTPGCEGQKRRCGPGVLTCTCRVRAYTGRNQTRGRQKSRKRGFWGAGGARRREKHAEKPSFPLKKGMTSPEEMGTITPHPTSPRPASSPAPG